MDVLAAIRPIIHARQPTSEGCASDDAALVARVSTESREIEVLMPLQLRTVSASLSPSVISASEPALHYAVCGSEQRLSMRRRLAVSGAGMIALNEVQRVFVCVMHFLTGGGEFQEQIGRVADGAVVIDRKSTFEIADFRAFQ